MKTLGKNTRKIYKLADRYTRKGVGVSVVRSVEVNIDPDEQESPKRISMPSFSGGFFVVSVGILLIWAILAIAALGYFTLKPLAEGMEKDFVWRYSETTALLAAQASDAVKKGSYTSLMNSMRDLIDKQNSDAIFANVHELFYLERSGQLAAHSDISKITANAGSRVSKVSGDYNNELFHSAVLNKKGEILVQEYPYEKYRGDHKFLILFESLLPEGFFNPMDFSAPVYLGSKSKGTMHLIVSRKYLYRLLHDYVATYFLALIGAIFSVVFAAIILAGYASSKIREYNRIIEAVAFAPLANRPPYNLEKEIKYIDEKIHEIENYAQRSPRDEKEVKEAILIKGD